MKGIAYPVTSYRVVDLYDNLAAGDQAIRSDLPHLTLDVDFKLMSAENRLSTIDTDVSPQTKSP